MKLQKINVKPAFFCKKKDSRLMFKQDNHMYVYLEKKKIF